jgi:hypothetical protein
VPAREVHRNGLYEGASERHDSWLVKDPALAAAAAGTYHGEGSACKNRTPGAGATLHGRCGSRPAEERMHGEAGIEACWLSSGHRPV